MIVWRNSTKPMTDEDFERVAKACAREQGQAYVHYQKFLGDRSVTLLVTCEHGRQFRTEILCDYIFPTEGVKQ